MQPTYGTDARGRPAPIRTTHQGRIVLPPLLYGLLGIIVVELAAILLVAMELLGAQ